MTKQASIKESSPRIYGTSIVSGKESYVRFRPADDGDGLSFLLDGEEIPVELSRAYRHKIWRSLRLANCIAIRGEKKTVYMVEHLLSTIYWMGIDNLKIEMSDNFCPRYDNSESEIVQALDELRVEGTADRHYLKVRNGLSEEQRTVTWKKGDDKLIVKPSDDFAIDYTSYYPHEAVGHQHCRVAVSPEDYKKHIMGARPIFFLPLGSRFMIDTFLRNLHGIRDSNSLLIGRKDNPDYVNTPEHKGKHGRKEFVYHKTQDAVGEIAMSGWYFKDTEFVFYKAGHEFDIHALRTLSDRECFDICF